MFACDLVIHVHVVTGEEILHLHLLWVDGQQLLAAAPHGHAPWSGFEQASMPEPQVSQDFPGFLVFGGSLDPIVPGPWQEPLLLDPGPPYTSLITKLTGNSKYLDLKTNTLVMFTSFTDVQNEGFIREQDVIISKYLSEPIGRTKVLNFL